MVAKERFAKSKDYWLTVWLVDPLAIPITKWLYVRTGVVSPNSISVLTLLLAIASGVAFYQSPRLGAILWFSAFLADCIDGKLARLYILTGLKPPSERQAIMGEVYDRGVDGVRRVAPLLGLGLGQWPDSKWIFAFALASWLNIHLRLFKNKIPNLKQRYSGRWYEFTKRHRMTSLPGLEDFQFIAFIIGPLTGQISLTFALMTGAAFIGALSVGRDILFPPTEDLEDWTDWRI